MPDRDPSASDDEKQNPRIRPWEWMMSSVSSILLQPAEFPAACKLTGAPLKLLEVNLPNLLSNGARASAKLSQSLTEPA